MPSATRAILTDLHGDLVGGATDAAALHLEHRLDVVQGLLEDLEGVFLLLLDQAKAP